MVIWNEPTRVWMFGNRSIVLENYHQAYAGGMRSETVLVAATRRIRDKANLLWQYLYKLENNDRYCTHRMKAY